METRIQKTLLHWFPEAFEETRNPSEVSDYTVLRQFAEYTLSLIKGNDETRKEPFRIIHLLYSNGSLYERNAIENEFFNTLTSAEDCMTLKEHLELLPEELRAVYIKTILENLQHRI